MTMNRCDDCGAAWTAEQPLIRLEDARLCETCFHAALDFEEDVHLAG